MLKKLFDCFFFIIGIMKKGVVGISFDFDELGKFGFLVNEVVEGDDVGVFSCVVDRKLVVDVFDCLIYFCVYEVLGDVFVGEYLILGSEVKGCLFVFVENFIWFDVINVWVEENFYYSEIVLIVGLV